MIPETPEARDARLLAQHRTNQYFRHQQAIANLRVEPQPFWTRALTNIWSRSFYLATFAFPLLIVSTLWILRPRELDLRAYLLTWAFAAPVGFLLWVFGWKTYGAGTGQVTATVAAAALLGWCVWNRGVYLTLIDRKLITGVAFCLTSLLALFCTKATIGTGVGPIKLAIAAALIEVGIPLTIAFVFKANQLQRVAFRKFGTPVWRFLTQPVTFRKWVSVDETRGVEG